MKITITRADIRPTMSVSEFSTKISEDEDGNVVKARIENVTHFDEPKMVGEFEFIVKDHTVMSNNDICNVICGESVVRCRALSRGDGSFHLMSLTKQEVLNGIFRLPEEIIVVAKTFVE